MSNEIIYFITLCKAYLNGETVTLEKNIDYEQLYVISNSHNLSAVLFCVINTSENRDVVPTEVFRKFQNDFYEAVLRYDIQSKVLSDLDQTLSDCGIRHIFFKGAEIKEYFPVPQARVMGDIDVLIDEDLRGKAKKILPQNGFQIVNANGPVYDYYKNDIKVEVHTKIVSGKVGNSDAEQCFTNAIDYGTFDGYRGTLPPDYHFAYLITHIAHHFWFYGAGVKLILDLAVMQKTFQINYDAVFEILDKVGLLSFSKVILSVCYQWFNTGRDFGAETEDTKRFLLSFGAFGNVNRNRAAVIERKELEEGKRNSKFKTRLRLLFPPYEKLKNIPYIKFIEGRPYLLVFAWVYRIYYNFRYKKDYVKSTTGKIGSDESNSQAESEFAYFKEIGLL